MDDLTWGAPFLVFLVPTIVRSVRWLLRSPRCPYCSALIRNGAVMCRRCERREVEVTDVPFVDLFDLAQRSEGEADDPGKAVHAGEATP